MDTDVKQSAGQATLAQATAISEISDRLDHLFLEHNPKESLGPCLIIFSRPGRGRRGIRYGHFHPESWTKHVDGLIVPEISINPEVMFEGLQETIQTLVHEKCHQWQYAYGKPGKKGYHNAQFAQKMMAVGLKPICSDKNAKDGQVTGIKVHDKIIEDGLVDKFVKNLPENLKLPFIGLSHGVKAAATTTAYVKYKCLVCSSSVRGKRGLNIKCIDCNFQMLCFGE